MLKSLRRVRRAERGQVLPLVLVVVGAFALLSIAALRMASIGAVARGESSVTAGSNALSEGSVLLANANESRFDVGPCPTGGSSGMALFDSNGVSDTLSYSLPNCADANGFPGNGPGRRCGLCLLNPSTGSNGPALSTKRFLVVAGEVDINGSAATTNQGAVCSSGSTTFPTQFSQCDGGGIIRYYTASMPPDGGNYTNWSPTPQLTTGPLTDPLASAFGTPLTIPSLGNKTLHTGDVWAAGVYNNVSIKNDSAQIGAGVHVVTGTLTVDNNANLTMANGATAIIYFGPSAQLVFGTQSLLQVAGLPSSDPSYPNIAIYFDRGNTTTVNDSGTSATLSVSGTIYAPRTTFAFGDAQPALLPFRLIAWAVSFTGNPNGTGLTVNAGGFPVLCSQYEVAGSATAASTDGDIPANTRGVSPYGKSHGKFQECRGGLSTTSAISQFNYVP